MSEPWIQTYGAGVFHPEKLQDNRYNIKAIAHSNSMMCRFRGHCNKFYSVAEHEVRVARWLMETTPQWQEVHYQGLMHDTHEAFWIGDIPAPYKGLGLLRDAVSFEEKIMTSLSNFFKFPFPFPHAIKVADKVLLVTEARDLMRPVVANWHEEIGYNPLNSKIRPWSPHKARREFLDLFYKLSPFPRPRSLFYF